MVRVKRTVPKLLLYEYSIVRSSSGASEQLQQEATLLIKNKKNYHIKQNILQYSTRSKGTYCSLTHSTGTSAPNSIGSKVEYFFTNFLKGFNTLYLYSITVWSRYLQIFGNKLKNIPDRQQCVHFWKLQKRATVNHFTLISSNNINCNLGKTTKSNRIHKKNTWSDIIHSNI